MKKVTVNNLEETVNLAKEFAKMLVGGEVVLLGGDLGAGKTTFTKAVLRALGVKDDVTSPTFTIMREYKGSQLQVYHFDMYRLTSGVEAQEFGMEDYIYSGEKNAVVFIEWADNIKDILKGEFLFVDIEIVDDNKREFSIERRYL